MSWQSWEKEAEKGPVNFVVKVGLTLILLVLFFSVIGVGLNWLFSGGRVAQKEFSPEAMFSKYEWFKDASAQLDASQASIEIHEKKIVQLKEDYGNKPRVEWTREDREQSNLWQQEVAGLKARFNQLAAEYNAGMVKFNYRRRS